MKLIANDNKNVIMLMWLMLFGSLANGYKNGYDDDDGDGDNIMRKRIW